MELKIELMEVFLNGGIDAVFKEKNFNSKIRNSKLSTREEKILNHLGCEMTPKEFFTYLSQTKCYLTEEEQTFLDDKYDNSEVITLPQEVIDSKKILQLLPTIMKSDIRSNMIDFISQNLNFREYSEEKMTKQINKMEKPQETDPMMLLFETDRTKAKSKNGKTLTALQTLNELMLNKKTIEEESNIFMLYPKSTQIEEGIWVKEGVTMRTLFEAVYLSTPYLYENEYKWLRDIISAHVWNIYMLPYLPESAKQEVVGLIPLLEYLSRRAGVSPKEILEDVISIPQPNVDENHTVFGTVFKDTVFIKDGEMAVIDETIIGELDLEALDFKGGILVTNTTPVQDIYFKFKETMNNYLINRKE